MTTTTTSLRVASRFLRADAFIRLNPIPVVIADGGYVGTADLQRLLKNQDIEAHDIFLYRMDDDPTNVFRWEGHDAGGPVMGRLELKVEHDPHHVIVSGEIVLATQVRNAADGAEANHTVRNRLNTIAALARRAIADLRHNPHDVHAVVARLVEIADVTESLMWMD